MSHDTEGKDNWRSLASTGSMLFVPRHFIAHMLELRIGVCKLAEIVSSRVIASGDNCDIIIGAGRENDMCT